MSLIKIAIISDMHCMHSSKETPPGTISTYLHSDDIGRSENRHPIKALSKLIKSDQLEAHLVLCPGDITNQADRQGLLSGWSYLEKIQCELKAKNIVATVGNHDIESRNDALGNVFLDLQSLNPNYPTPSSSTNSYWSSGYSIVELDNVLILNINSCFFHGNSTTAKKSKIDVSQLESIDKELSAKNLALFSYKIVLIHHHPIIHSNLDYEDVDKLERGDELLRLANKFKFQIIVHGHKHDPRITSVDSIPVFCAGSFSSLMNVTNLKSDNTFHILHLEENSPKGYIQTWIYAPQEGWVYRQDTPFPCLTGFGFSGDTEILAKKVNDWLTTATVGKMSYYKELLEQFPDLNYLSRDSQKELTDHLKTNFDLQFHPDYPNKPEIILPLIK